MFSLWWPTFIVPVLMVLCGLVGNKISGFHYRSPSGPLSEARQQFADRQLLHMLRQFGAAYAALAFMIMRSVRLLADGVQHWLLYGAVLLEIVGVLLLIVPVERALKVEFQEDTDKGDHA